LREIIDSVLNVVRPLRSLVLISAAVALACPAQPQAKPTASSLQIGAKLPVDVARRIEVMIRSRSEVPSDYVIAISNPEKSEVAGYDQIIVTFSADGNVSRPLTFLLSTDAKTLVQFNKFDISQDPRDVVSAAGRPARGGPENAPVLIVGFDDLECPFCAKLNAQIFPAVLDRYKDQVRVVYRDFPLDQHLWAMHAAVDANCLAAGNPTAYWNYVDYVHAHSGDLGADDKSLPSATQTLDKLATDEGARQKMNAADLAACIQKQDTARIAASVKEAEATPLNIGSTPVLFINGEKIEGVLPMDMLYRIIDSALVAAGQTPPPAPPPPPATTPQATPPATKPGS
jgi:protein-disulfide isomerase